MFLFPLIEMWWLSEDRDVQTDLNLLFVYLIRFLFILHDIKKCQYFKSGWSNSWTVNYYFLNLLWDCFICMYKCIVLHCWSDYLKHIFIGWFITHHVSSSLIGCNVSICCISFSFFFQLWKKVLIKCLVYPSAAFFFKSGIKIWVCFWCWQNYFYADTGCLVYWQLVCR